jgi:hypothetical protein
MTTNTLVSISMTPVEPLEVREWAAIGGYRKNIGLRFRCHAQITFKGGGTDDPIVAIRPRPTRIIFLRRKLSERSPRIDPDRRPNYSAIT